MSFVGNPLTPAHSSTHKELPPSKFDTERKKARVQFAKFQKARKTELVLAGHPPAEDKLNMCACGQHKRQSAAHCDECADECSILRQQIRYAELEYIRAKQDRVGGCEIRQIPQYARNHKSIAETDYADNFLDELLNNYEESLSRLD